MNIAFFENLVVIFQSYWIMYFALTIMMVYYAIKFDMSYEVLIMFLLAFNIWFGFSFLPLWYPILFIIGGIFLLVTQFNKIAK